MRKEIEVIKEKIRPILRQHGIKRAGLFGSYARGEMKADSDVDILVELEENISLLDFIGIKLELEDVLGKKVDLVEYNTIKPLLRERILSEEVAII